MSLYLLPLWILTILLEPRKRCEVIQARISFRDGLLEPPVSFIRSTQCKFDQNDPDRGNVLLSRPTLHTVEYFLSFITLARKSMGPRKDRLKPEVLVKIKRLLRFLNCQIVFGEPCMNASLPTVDCRRIW